MIIEYLPDGLPDCPLLRISETSLNDIRQLLMAWEKLSKQESEKYELKSDNIELLCKSGEKDIGLQQISNHIFECTLACETWLQVHGLTEPFLDDQTGYQWLSEDGPIRFLLSPGGKW